MSLSKNCLNISYRLTLITLATALAGCSLNPFSGDSSADRPVVQAVSTTRPESRSDTMA